MTLVLLSGGLDSTVLAAHTCALPETLDGERVEALSVNYGQRHARELDSAAKVAAVLGIRHDTIDLSALREHLTGSALTDGDRVDVPEGHYAELSMKATVVPNRNMIMLAVAAAVAVARGHKTVGTAVHAGDHPIYPDCRPEFIAAVCVAAMLGTAGHGDAEIVAPFARWSKADIARTGHALGAPMHLSWSCYKGGDLHCGRCGTCVERAEAFHLAKVTDPTIYADPGYFLTANAPAAGYRVMRNLDEARAAYGLPRTSRHGANTDPDPSMGYDGPAAQALR